MRRGELVATPAPEANLDWRVLVVDPYGWRASVVMLLLRLGQGRAAAHFMKSKRHADNWIRKQDERLVMDIVVIGSEALRHAVELVVRRDRLWVNRVYGYPTWHDYSAEARTNARLVKLIIPQSTMIPVLQGIRIERYQGFTHEV